MKVIFTKYVYARISAPSTDSSFLKVRNPGESIEIDDIVIGTEIDGNSIWYHCAEDACFYWSGGFAITNDVLDLHNNKEDYSSTEKFGFYESAANELDIKFRHLPGYNGIAVGFSDMKKIGEPGPSPRLIVSFGKSSRNAVPEIDRQIPYRGLLIEVDVETGTAMKLQAVNEKTPPYLMGGSMASVDPLDNKEKTGFGTRSLLVQKDNKPFLLGCYHVACAGLFAKSEYALNSKDLFVNIPSAGRAAGAEIIKCNVVEGRFGNNYDWALMAIDSQDVLNSLPGRPFNNGFYNLAELKNGALLNETVFTFGATSLKGSSGTVKRYPANNIPVDDKLGLKMSGLIAVTSMSDHGDSGAPVVDQRNKLVGMIIGGKDGLSYIVPFAQLFFDFHFKPAP